MSVSLPLRLSFSECIIVSIFLSVCLSNPFIYLSLFVSFLSVSSFFFRRRSSNFPNLFVVLCAVHFFMSVIRASFSLKTRSLTYSPSFGSHDHSRLLVLYTGSAGILFSRVYVFDVPYEVHNK